MGFSGWANTTNNASTTESFSATDSRHHTPSAIIIGADLTGLSAAYELQKSGIKVTVLTEHDSVGKPEYSFTRHFLDATTPYTDISYPNTSQQDALHEQVHGYIALFGMQGLDSKALPTDTLKGNYYLNGKLIGFHDLLNVFNQKVTPDYQRFWQALKGLNRNSVAALEAKTKQRYLSQHPYSLHYENRLNQPLTAQDWLNSLALQPSALMLAQHHIKAVFGEPSKVSALSLGKMQKQHNHQKDQQAQVYRILGGDQLLANSLANKLASSILINQKISTITHNHEGVLVSTQQQDFSANQLLITRALPKLAELEFSPALPHVVLSSAQRLNYGAFHKVILNYQPEFFEILKTQNSKLPMGWIMGNSSQDSSQSLPQPSANTQQTNPTLISYSSGNLIEGQVYNNEQHIIAIKRAQLANQFPISKQFFISASVQAWHREPWPGGNYITDSAQELTSYWNSFSNSQEKVYFASSQFDNQTPGTLEGALYAGKKVALKMAQQIYIKAASQQVASGY